MTIENLHAFATLPYRLSKTIPDTAETMVRAVTISVRERVHVRTTP